MSLSRSRRRFGHRWQRQRISRKRLRSRSFRNCTPTFWWSVTDGDRNQDARALPHTGGGNDRQMVREGGGQGDRKSVVSGKGVSVRVDLGGGGIIKKQTNN